MKCKAVLKDKSADGRLNIKIRITYERKVLYLKTEYYVFNEDFDTKLGRLKSVNLKKNNIDLANKKLKHEKINAEITRQIADLEAKYASISFDKNISDIHSLLKIITTKTGDDVDFYEYTTELSLKIAKNSPNYASSLSYTNNVLKKFTKKEKLLFSEINYSFLKEFENYLLNNEKMVNTIAVYMRNIRSIFNKAIDDDIIEINIYPFRKYKIKKEQTAKRNISIKEILKIEKLELTNNLEIIARDIFLLSFYLIGMNIIDILNLKKINKDRVDFRRSKTKKLYSIKLHSKAKQLIDKYSGSKYLLSFKEDYSDYRNFTKMVNKKLKDIADNAKIEVALSSYYARHSWATIASELNISKDIIRHALGHGTNTVTDIYIDFDMDKVDNANFKVINSIK